MKKKSTRKKRRENIIIIAMFILLLVFFGYTLINTSMFNVKDIKLYGNSTLTEEDIIKYGNIELQNNILSYSINNIENKIEKHPYIKSVEVKRNFPDNIIINIKEKNEIAIINSEEKYIYLDENATVLKIDDNITNKNIPIINNIEVSSYDVGKVINIENKEIKEDIIELISKLHSTKMYTEFKSIDYKDGFTLQTKRGISINISSTEELAYKFDVMNEVLTDLQTRGISRGKIQIGDQNYAIYKP